ncbi:MarC family protein [Cyanobium sp. LEGE 06143]|uniref:MarC family protein n=1 Tax=Cyanobium sp. LEGE 06143 TaxID=945727 RepID=UPI00187ECFCF|nr:MarC family protein [Cyanobium sp. LEGE 06143]MBE9172814.1 MarC family protein [Cyanobium sp. LEGE 06143]
MSGGNGGADLNRSVITLLALVNPVICSAMLLQHCGGAPRAQRLRGVATVVLRTGAILLLSAFFGPRLLATLGISLDTFRIMGGLVIASIGYGMFQAGGSETASPERAPSPPCSPWR